MYIGRCGLIGVVWLVWFGWCILVGVSWLVWFALDLFLGLLDNFRWCGLVVEVRITIF